MANPLPTIWGRRNLVESDRGDADVFCQCGRGLCAATHRQRRHGGQCAGYGDDHDGQYGAGGAGRARSKCVGGAGGHPGWERVE